MNSSPCCTVRESIATPATDQSPRALPPVAAASSAAVQSASVMPRAPPSSARAARTSIASSNGSTRSPTICPVSWPLPATTRTSPASSAADRGADRGPRGRRSRRAPGQASRIARRIAAGSSLRGLSSVTNTRSARAAAIAPISGRLPRSRSPPQPNTHDQAPLGMRAERVQRLGERVRLVGVVDEDRRAARVDADPLHSAGRALELAEQRSQPLGRRQWPPPDRAPPAGCSPGTRRPAGSGSHAAGRRGPS